MVDTKVEKTYGSIDGTNEPIVNVDSGGVDGFYFFYKQKDLSKKRKNNENDQACRAYHHRGDTYWWNRMDSI